MVLEKIFQDGYLGKIADKVLEFTAEFLFQDEIVLEKFFEYLKKGDFDIEEEYEKYFSFSEHEKKYLFPLFVSFWEIWNAFEEFEDIIFYIKNYPNIDEYKKRKDLLFWGNYHLRSVNQQFFILRERILRLIKIIEKIAVTDKDKRFLKLKKLRKEVLDYFDPIVKARHELVHVEGFLDIKLLEIAERGSVMEKRGKKRIIKSGPDVDTKIKKELDKKVREVIKEIELLGSFLNSNFKIVWEIIKDW